MNFKDIVKRLKAEDSPILEIPESEKLINFFRTIDNDITFMEISKKIDIPLERLFEINQQMGMHFKENLAPKVFFKAMLNTAKDNNEEFIQFFQRPDVDLCCNLLFKVVDVKQNLRNLGTPQYEFLFDNWKKYRGY